MAFYRVSNGGMLLNPNEYIEMSYNVPNGYKGTFILGNTISKTVGGNSYWAFFGNIENATSCNTNANVILTAFFDDRMNLLGTELSLTASATYCLACLGSYTTIQFI